MDRPIPLQGTSVPQPCCLWRCIATYSPHQGPLQCRQAAAFGLASFLSFASLGWACYCMYGDQFVREAYTFHLTRRDPRHNFSAYFYPTYLRHFRATRAHSADSHATVDPGALAVVPQAAAILLLSLRFHHHLPLCWLLATMTFVAFNKVSSHC